MVYNLEDITDSYGMDWILGADGKYRPPHCNPDAKPDHADCRCVVIENIDGQRNGN